MENLTREVTAGAAGGLAGGIVLTGAMLAAERLGLVDKSLPVKVERWTAYHAGVDPEDLKGPVTIGEEAVAHSGHLVASAALGATYGVLRARYDAPAVSSGLVFGLGLFALNLGVIGPALTITRKPWNERPRILGQRAVLHALFGVVTAVVAERIARR